jgi:membrane-associated phospholipid phosphatase
LLAALSCYNGESTPYSSSDRRGRAEEALNKVRTPWPVNSLVLPGVPNMPVQLLPFRKGALRMSSLLTGIGLFVVLMIAFAYVADAALTKDPPGKFDIDWALRLKRVGDNRPENTPWIKAVTLLGSRYMLAAVALAGTLWQVRRRRVWLAVAWVVIASGGYALNEGVKQLAQRPRPPLELREPGVTESSFSFPSGHAMGSFIGYGLLCYVLILQAKKRYQVIVPLVDLSIIVFAIGFSRIYLRVHWATDVIGGFLLGGAWLALTLGFLEAWRRGNGIMMEPTSATPAPAG